MTLQRASPTVGPLLEESCLDPTGSNAVLDGMRAKWVRLTFLRSTRKYAQVTEMELY